jgi:hypothetical protein
VPGFSAGLVIGRYESGRAGRMPWSRPAAARPNTLAVMNWNIEFFADDEGRMPAYEWLRSLPFPAKSAAIGAIEFVLVELGPGVCATEQGENLGEGLFALRVRHAEGEGPAGVGGPVSLRIHCHGGEAGLVTILAGLDEEAAPGERPRRREVDVARRRLRSLLLRRARRTAGERRRG